MIERSKKNTVHERIPIGGTPFTMAKNDNGYTLLMGLYALTPTFKTKQQVVKFMKDNEWNLMVNVMHAMLDFHKLIKKEEEPNKQQKEIPFNKEEEK